MAIKPILFNTEMVRAILDGRKSCTRRINKDANDYVVPDMDFFDPEKRTYAVHNYADKEHKIKLSIAERSCPICPGDILYVRESVFQGVAHCLDVSGETECVLTNDFEYYADGLHKKDHWKDKHENIWMHRRPSIHMPKEAARIWLKVTDARVERLQEITEVQAQAEGCNSGLLTGACTARGQFEDLWNSTVKKSDIDRYGWDANSYVWVIEFERCEKPKT
ncbi:hypothetical protein DW927_11980 [Roseburia intestinalis]|jgi:hypothetical protein|uniref:ASCH domain-containing protein n=1 Tax=Roseburia intestinalis TaxID=166486 RepID=A0A413SGB5_9FIRM|nr:hypothetical protein [Roseburia intestinalis]RHA66250.1 hypothetical protein DW927_11980 [Roseburia intestinalis]